MLKYWFQFSKNGRKELAPGKKKRQYLNPNNSTMNRICARFNDIGNINLRTADVPPFNWQMLLSKPCNDERYDICKMFCDMDDINKSDVIDSIEYDYCSERETKANYELLASMIVEDMTAKYGSLEENVYPYIVKYLFTGNNADKTQHKQMFWRVFGDIALKNIKANLATCKICEKCKMQYPAWADKHYCAKTTKGFTVCVKCGSVFKQQGPKQCRCEKCQEEYRREMVNARVKAIYTHAKQKKEANRLQKINNLKG